MVRSPALQAGGIGSNPFGSIVSVFIRLIGRTQLEMLEMLVRVRHETLTVFVLIGKDQPEEIGLMILSKGWSPPVFED